MYTYLGVDVYIALGLHEREKDMSESEWAMVRMPGTMKHRLDVLREYYQGRAEMKAELLGEKRKAKIALHDIIEMLLDREWDRIDEQRRKAREELKCRADVVLLGDPNEPVCEE